MAGEALGRRRAEVDDQVVAVRADQRHAAVQLVAAPLGHPLAHARRSSSAAVGSAAPAVSGAPSPASGTVEE